VAHAGGSSSGDDFSEKPWDFGEVVEIPPKAIEGAEAIVRESMKQWSVVYEELQQELRCNDLAHVLREAYGLPSAEEALAISTAMAVETVETVQTTTGSRVKSGWQNIEGCWVDSPLDARVRVLVQADDDDVLRVVMKAGDKKWKFLGEDAKGIRGVACEYSEICQLTPKWAKDYQGPEVDWLKDITDGAFVLISVVDASREEISNLCEMMREQQIANMRNLPSECRILAVAAVKGRPELCYPVAGKDDAQSTLPFEMSTVVSSAVSSSTSVGNVGGT